jgi:hypothetical protein
MLKIIVPASEQFDPAHGTFVETSEQALNLEHSLISISKWESKWRKPFISKTPMTSEELIDYVRCMTLTQNVNPLTYNSLTKKNIDQVINYIDTDMTATTFSKMNGSAPSREIITSELIYYWMVAFNIPFECQKWHLNRLITLIRVCSIKNTPPKKMSKRETASRYRSLNAQRRAKHHTRG